MSLTRLAITAVAGLLAIGACAEDGWRVKRAAAPSWEAMRWGAKLALTPDGMTILQRKRKPLHISRDAITAFAYVPVEFSHGKSIVNNELPAASIGALPLAIAALALYKTRKYDHFIVVHWKDLGLVREEVIEAGKKDYQAILAALEKTTGRPPVEGFIGLPSGAAYGHDVRIFDEKGYAVNIRRELLDGQPAYCIPVKHEDDTDCHGTLCVSRNSVSYRLGLAGDESHEFEIPVAYVAARRPRTPENTVTVDSARKVKLRPITQGVGPLAPAITDAVSFFWLAATDFDGVDTELESYRRR